MVVSSWLWAPLANTTHLCTDELLVTCGDRASAPPSWHDGCTSSDSQSERSENEHVQAQFGRHSVYYTRPRFCFLVVSQLLCVVRFTVRDMRSLRTVKCVLGTCTVTYTVTRTVTCSNFTKSTLERVECVERDLPRSDSEALRLCERQTHGVLGQRGCDASLNPQNCVTNLISQFVRFRVIEFWALIVTFWVWNEHSMSLYGVVTMLSLST